MNVIDRIIIENTQLSVARRLEHDPRKRFYKLDITDIKCVDDGYIDLAAVVANRQRSYLDTRWKPDVIFWIIFLCFVPIIILGLITSMFSISLISGLFITLWIRSYKWYFNKNIISKRGGNKHDSVYRSEEQRQRS